MRRKNVERKHDGKPIDVIYGIYDKDGTRTSEVQALRYPVERWDADAARSHCKKENGSFEAAAKPAAKSVSDEILTELVAKALTQAVEELTNG